MKISDTITEKILTDNNFSMELAKKIGIQQGSPHTQTLGSRDVLQRTRLYRGRNL